MLNLASGDQRIDVDAFPLCVGTVPARTIEVIIVQVAARGALLRRGDLEGGNRLLGAARREQPPTDLSRLFRSSPVFIGHEGDVRIHILFPVGEVLQSTPHGCGAAIIVVGGSAFRHRSDQPGLERRDAALAQCREDSGYQAVELAIVILCHRGEHVLGERDGIGFGPRCEGAEIITGCAEHSTDRAVTVVDAVDDGLCERHEPPHQVESQIWARLTDALGDRCPREVKIPHEIGALLQINERTGGS